MKILLVGGTSLVIKVLIPVLRDLGEVVTAGRKNCDVYLDLSDIKNPLSFPTGFDVVVHAAANFGGKTAEEMIDAEMINVIGTLRLCQASVATGVKHFIFISSIYSLLPPESDYYSIYALSKKHAEETAFFFCQQQGLPLTILKPAQLYGNTDAFAKHQPFLYAIVKKVQQGENINLYGKHDALRNFLHVDDLAQIILRVIQRNMIGIYACQYPVNISMSQLASAAISAFDGKQKICFLEEKSDIKDNIFPIDETLYQKINFYPTIDIVEGMRMIAKNMING